MGLYISRDTDVLLRFLPRVMEMIVRCANPSSREIYRRSNSIKVILNRNETGCLSLETKRKRRYRWKRGQVNRTSNGKQVRMQVGYWTCKRAYEGQPFVVWLSPILCVKIFSIHYCDDLAILSTLAINVSLYSPSRRFKRHDVLHSKVRQLDP
jgi:hypothetical protein